MKPFRPPLLINRSQTETQWATSNGEPLAKKRRITSDIDDEDVEVITAATNVLKKSQPPEKFRPPIRKPLETVQNPTQSASRSDESHAGSEAYYIVLWRRFTTKKNKTWDGDGILSVRDSAAVLKDVSGKELGRGVCKSSLDVGSQISISGKEIEIESVISKQDYLAGRPSLASSKPATPPSASSQVGRSSGIRDRPLPKVVSSQKERLVPVVVPGTAGKARFKTPLLENTVQRQRKDAKVPVPRHDPTAPGALVMKRPRVAPKGKQLVDVVVDPLLTKHLREHQRTGVQFMYECVMGMKADSGEGAILADEMGLGKTLQTIALLWTLLKQNPIYDEPPVIQKALVVCPVTLINNWRKEFHRWLGKERVGVFVAGNKDLRVTDFTRGRSYSVMIIGYERLRTVQVELQQCQGIDIVIADEGHRLKTAQNKAALAIKSLSTERRIILSGTPIQNDLTEFYTMVDFVNPGLLGKYTTFKREFETPIVQGRQPGASADEMEDGEARSAELGTITAPFILRRTMEILSAYLPPKTEYVVFCRPTPAQVAVYRAALDSPGFTAALGSPAASLGLINVLRKVCNSPGLLLHGPPADPGEDGSGAESGFVQHIPAALLRQCSSPAGSSGKIHVLVSLLRHIRATTRDRSGGGDKVVVVSNYTSTLDVLSAVVQAEGYGQARLDGRTPAAQRQAVVDRFNRAAAGAAFVFLLSAQAGGAGLNLVGASRLVLFDGAWNPAVDAQAMARIHRDGQTRPCRIYRLVTRGALDEKIFQRQVGKTALAARFVDGARSARPEGFTQDELRDLFSLDLAPPGGCQTHALLRCPCPGDGHPVRCPEEAEVGAGERVSSDDDCLGEDEGAEERSLAGDDCLDEDAEGGKEDGFVSEGCHATPEVVVVRGREEQLLQISRAREQKAQRLGLMQYTHFDPARHISADVAGERGDDDGDDESPDGDSVLEIAIEDTALRRMLCEKGHRIGYVFTKLSSCDAGSVSG